MKRRRKKATNSVPRPTHPGRSIYTCILNNKMSTGELAAIIGYSRAQLGAILKGNKRLEPRVAFLLSEQFGWDLALRWLMMQTKCNMYEAAIRERKDRRVLMGDDKSDVGSPEWEEEVRQAWEDVDQDDYDERVSYPVVSNEIKRKVTMKEDLNEQLSEDGMAGTGGDDGPTADSGSDEAGHGEGGGGLPAPSGGSEADRS